MNFFRRIFNLIFNRYEGGQRWSNARSWLPSGPNQDPRFDADSVTREELVRKSRYFERNNAIVNRLADLFEQFTVGPNGLQFVPASTDEKWNTAAKAWFDQWCKVCDVTSLHSFSTIQSLAARCWFIDGEVFIQKTKGEVPETGQPTARPRINLLEAHRIATPPEKISNGKIIDGVEIDDRGRPIRYWVRERISEPGQPEVFKAYPADEIIHIFEPSRPGQYRGLPFLYPVLNDLHDLDDMQILEIDTAKEHASITNVIKNATGQPNPSQMTRSRFSTKTQGTAGTDIDQNRFAYLNKKGRSQAVYCRNNEDFQQFRSDRPSAATQWLWDYMTWKVCVGTGISKLLVFPESMQGTVVRGEYDIACAFFASRSGVLANAFGRIRDWVMEWAVANDRRVADKPGNWREYTVQTPRSVNVDVGRNSAAMLAELEAGATTYAEIYGPLGKDWRIQIRQRFIEEAYINQLSELPEYKGITPDRIRASIGDHLDRIAAEQDRRAQEDNAPAKPPVYAD